MPVYTNQFIQVHTQQLVTHTLILLHVQQYCLNMLISYFFKSRNDNFFRKIHFRNTEVLSCLLASIYSQKNKLNFLTKM